MPKAANYQMPKHDYEYDEAVLTQERTKIDEPPRYRVVLHNDDFTTMEFVIQVLETIFNLSIPEAIRVMLEVHTGGRGVAGTYTLEIAEMKVAKTIAFAQQHEYPLLCTTEEE